MILRRLILTLIFVRLTALQEIGVSDMLSSIIIVKSTAILTCLLKCNTSDKRNVTEFRMSLLRGTDKSQEVCAGSFSRSYKPFNQSTESFNCLGIPSATNVTFHIWNLKVEHTDIYFCKTEFMAPPPYCFKEDNGTIIHVKEDLSCEAPLPSTEAPPPFTWIMLGLVAALAVYAILVSLTLIYFWQRRRKENMTLQSDYVNVTPQLCSQKQHRPQVPSRSNKLR